MLHSNNRIKAISSSAYQTSVIHSMNLEQASDIHSPLWHLLVTLDIMQCVGRVEQDAEFYLLKLPVFYWSQMIYIKDMLMLMLYPP